MGEGINLIEYTPISESRVWESITNHGQQKLLLLLGFAKAIIPYWVKVCTINGKSSPNITCIMNHVNMKYKTARTPTKLVVGP